MRFPAPKGQSDGTASLALPDILEIRTSSAVWAYLLPTATVNAEHGRH